MYSSIEEEQRGEVIKTCYYPLLDIAENYIPLGIELPGITLEIINNLAPDFINRLKSLIDDKKVELIGSGYSQIIGPLWPKRLNIENQLIGLDVYKRIVGVKPKIAFINEMAYSAGIVDIYKDVGYKSIVMEWNNPYRFRKEWDKNLKYFPCFAKSIKSKLPVIWADSIVFQKFQRYAHGEIPLKEYMSFIENQDKTDGYFPLYTNDAEIFNFRPGRYKTEKIIEHNEWNRIKKLFCVLKNKGFKFVLPSESLKDIKHIQLQLESPEQPIPVKKQEKYNINRWAVTGRDDLSINTQVYKLIKILERKETDKNEWKKLLYFASSDFRTHITEKRWFKLQVELNEFQREINKCKIKNHRKIKCKGFINYKINQNKYYLQVETQKLICVFNKLKGLTAQKLIFKKFDLPILGTIPHGYYDDISFGADFFSFHSIIEIPGQHKCTNLKQSDFNLSTEYDKIIINEKQTASGVTFTKNYYIFNDKIKIETVLQLEERKIAIIHPFNVTFIPEAFDKDSLFYATHNGCELEKFKLKNKIINHSQSLSALISSKYGLGSTEGVVIIGDKFKQVIISHDKTKSALIPTIHYKPMEETFFLRLQYSAQEIDDTFRPNKKPHIIKSLFDIFIAY